MNFSTMKHLKVLEPQIVRLCRCEPQKRLRSTMSEASRHDRRYAELPPELRTYRHQIQAYALNNEVISCAEAADAKGIALGQELKSMVLYTSKGLFVAHLPGDKRIKYRSIKNLLSVREASLAGLDTLEELGLSPGTVCAVREPVWSLPHLISREVLQENFVSTNDGTRGGYLVFSPALLLKSARYYLLTHMH